MTKRTPAVTARGGKIDANEENPDGPDNKLTAMLRNPVTRLKTRPMRIAIRGEYPVSSSLCNRLNIYLFTDEVASTEVISLRDSSFLLGMTNQ